MPATPRTDRRLRDALRKLIVAHGALEHARRPCGAELSLPHAYALLELLSNDGELTVSDLAARLSIDRTNVSRLCARMEASGELTRETHPHDGRARVLRLTPHGRKLAAAADRSSSRYFGQIGNALGPSLEETVHSLEQLTQTLEQHRNQS